MQFNLRAALLFTMFSCAWLAVQANWSMSDHAARSRLAKLGAAIGDIVLVAEGVSPSAPALSPINVLFPLYCGPRDQTLSLKRPRESPLTPHDFECITTLTQLRSIEIEQCLLSAGCLAMLPRVARLERLSLRMCSIDASDLASLAGLSKLSFLDLTRSTIRNGDVSELDECRALQTLVLNGTASVTSSRIGKLRAAMPNCKIDYFILPHLPQ